MEIIVDEIEKIPGLFLINNLDISANILDNLDKKEWQKNSRLVQHYGFKYDYFKKNIYEKTEDIPEFLVELQNTLKDICYQLELVKDEYDFNQCIVNNYTKGQCISSHTDFKSYGKVIGCYTLNNSVNMIFTKDHTVVKIKVDTNSLYIMSGECMKWKN